MRNNSILDMITVPNHTAFESIALLLCCWNNLSCFYFIKIERLVPFVINVLIREDFVFLSYGESPYFYPISLTDNLSINGDAEKRRNIF